MATQASDEFLGRVIKEHLQSELSKAAEPIVQEALAKFEVDIRKRVATVVLAAVEGGYSMERMGPDIRITVRRPEHAKE